MDEYTLWLTKGDAEMYARIIDAHYAQAEKADEARAGAVTVRAELRAMDSGGHLMSGYLLEDPAMFPEMTAHEQVLDASRFWAATIRADRVERDTMPRCFKCEGIQDEYTPHPHMPTVSATQQTENDL